MVQKSLNAFVVKAFGEFNDAPPKSNTSLLGVAKDTKHYYVKTW
jgi:hypothetical protein